MALVMWLVWDDSDGLDVEEQGWMVVAAETETDAIVLWRLQVGIGSDEGEPRAKRAEWRWPNVPEPIPVVSGVWPGEERTPNGRALGGYGLWIEGDPRCDDCGERTDQETAITRPATATEGELTFCPACAASHPIEVAGNFP